MDHASTPMVEISPANFEFFVKMGYVSSGPELPPLPPPLPPFYNYPSLADDIKEEEGEVDVEPSEIDLQAPLSTEMFRNPLENPHARRDDEENNTPPGKPGRNMRASGTPLPGRRIGSEIDLMNNRLQLLDKQRHQLDLVEKEISSEKNAMALVSGLMVKGISVKPQPDAPPSQPFQLLPDPIEDDDDVLLPERLIGAIRNEVDRVHRNFPNSSPGQGS